MGSVTVAIDAASSLAGKMELGAGEGTRTLDSLLGRQELYH
jgi:hypothetical protein